MKQSLAFVSVLGIFLLGIVIGGLGMRLVDSRFPRVMPPGMPGGIDAGHPGHPPFFERMHRELRLTPEQRDRIAEITAEAHEEGEAIRDEVEPRVRELMDRTRGRIAEVLTPEQREIFERISERHRARAERFLLGGPPRGAERDRRFRRPRPERPTP